jgi:hypothetical protein
MEQQTMKSKLADDDRIMALPPGSWIMAMEPVTVGDMQKGGTLTLPMGAKVRISSADGSSAFGVTEDCEWVSFGMQEAVSFEPVKHDRR